jgi:predicted DCC family thiol-disulfide oxidoreductase YuxK
MDADMTEPHKLTVFYDGSCPLCVREIGLYRSLKGADALAFIDISRCADTIVVPGLSKDAAMRRFHVMRPDGRISSGGPAFAHLWAALPRLRWLGRLFLVKPMPCVLDAAYTIVLPLRPSLQRIARRLFKRP